MCIRDRGQCVLLPPPGPGRELRVHGDDFAFAGLEEHLEWAQNRMETHFLCRLGGGESDLKEA
eukprot:7620622-Alexandrium_andersonii.AAC.1